MTELIDQLPPFDCLRHNFHYSITNWLPFCWKGFTQTTRYTYVIDNLCDTELVWKGFEAETRNQIRKAQKLVAVRTDLDLKSFLRVIGLTFARQGLQAPYSHDFVQRLHKACSDNNAVKIFFAEDAHRRIHAVLFLVWNSQSAYVLMQGGDPELRNSEAGSLLMWQAIQFSATVTKVFDCEGSMVEPIEKFYRGFGARQVPYFQITKYSPRYRFLVAARELRSAIPFRSLLRAACERTHRTK